MPFPMPLSEFLEGLFILGAVGVVIVWVIINDTRRMD